MQNIGISQTCSKSVGKLRTDGPSEAGAKDSRTKTASAASEGQALGSVHLLAAVWSLL